MFREVLGRFGEIFGGRFRGLWNMFGMLFGGLWDVSFEGFTKFAGGRKPIVKQM